MGIKIHYGDKEKFHDFSPIPAPEKVGNGGGLAEFMLPITHTELKALRDNGELVPGMQYRITDYQCIITQENTRSAGHQFDIIVTADSTNTLNENARACLHEGDTYFADCDLNAWELKYCLDNDTSRFEWASNIDGQAIINLSSGFSNGQPLVRQPLYDGGDDYLKELGYIYAWGTQADVDDDDVVDFIYSKNETLTDGEIVYNYNEGEEQIAEVVDDGKGVIYFMRDENGNECSYDFKNIQFNRYAIKATINDYPTLSELIYAQGEQDVMFSPLRNSQFYNVDTNTSTHYYTFSYISNTGYVEDLSVYKNTAYSVTTKGNKSLYVERTMEEKYLLPDNVIVVSDTWLENDWCEPIWIVANQMAGIGNTLSNWVVKNQINGDFNIILGEASGNMIDGSSNSLLNSNRNKVCGDNNVFAPLCGNVVIIGGNNQLRGRVEYSLIYGYNNLVDYQSRNVRIYTDNVQLWNVEYSGYMRNIVVEAGVSGRLNPTRELDYPVIYRPTGSQILEV